MNSEDILKVEWKCSFVREGWLIFLTKFSSIIYFIFNFVLDREDIYIYLKRIIRRPNSFSQGTLMLLLCFLYLFLFFNFIMENFKCIQRRQPSVWIPVDPSNSVITTSRQSRCSSALTQFPLQPPHYLKQTPDIIARDLLHISVCIPKRMISFIQP